ncbi:NADPH-dependent 1-acyldihydroxyacetone phosphate [Apiospora saccharicola]|uniref:NADPH-dependent 1-acyldihydroxyacetone phosphate n=1 Tax=Apiospora saccharicola TaxID=335842 RepID=A0ABR1TPM8_9PEZI
MSGDWGSWQLRTSPWYRGTSTTRKTTTIVNHSSVVWNLAIAWGGIYSTSKAAAKQLSEVLRVELEPLGVRVVTAIIGAVDTPIFENSHPGPLKMPSTSYCEPIRPFISEIREGKKQPEGLTSADEIARQMPLFPLLQPAAQTSPSTIGATRVGRPAQLLCSSARFAAGVSLPLLNQK